MSPNYIITNMIADKNNRYLIILMLNLYLCGGYLTQAEVDKYYIQINYDNSLTMYELLKIIAPMIKKSELLDYQQLETALWIWGVRRQSKVLTKAQCDEIRLLAKQP